MRAPDDPGAGSLGELLKFGSGCVFFQIDESEIGKLFQQGLPFLFTTLEDTAVNFSADGQDAGTVYLLGKIQNVGTLPCLEMISP